MIGKLLCKLGFHQGGIAGGPATGMYGHCIRCRLRSPEVPFVSGTWGIDLLKDAIRRGNAYYDKEAIGKKP